MKSKLALLLLTIPIAIASVYVSPWLTLLPVVFFFVAKRYRGEDFVFKMVLSTGFALLTLFQSLIYVRYLYILNNILTEDFGYGVPGEVSFANYETEVGLNEIFPLYLDVTNTNQPINIVSTDLLFDTDHLEFIGIDTTETFANFFVEESIIEDKGFIRLSGGKENPGVNEESFRFLTVYFRAKKVSETIITLLKTSDVLANDGKGTELFNEQNAEYKINISERKKFTEPKNKSVRDPRFDYFFKEGENMPINFGIIYMFKGNTKEFLDDVIQLNNKILSRYELFL